ncbi:two-component system sensor histidine kinase NtrB [Chondromyces apiculatus]|uniref:histidine kinase n=1 Tax=Chondromyces apiculatus DSM 436 TaxID=1192034 RepID=A0A017T7T7_9BACT|nr:ATP-binding protein [Chondromyces apiculatus]EYF04641.1 putative PAS/PAC sensor protein [Chondromyces apiculatus DSM 436]
MSREAHEEPRRALLAVRQSEARLRETEERLSYALAHTRTLILEQDSALRYTRAEPGEGIANTVLGRTDEELLEPGDAATLLAMKRGVLASGAPVREDVELTIEGERRCYDLAIEPLYGPRGETIGVTTIAADITERRRAEDARRGREERIHEAQRMESLGMLAGGVAHDFNNLLMSILSFAELALTDVPQGAAVCDDIERIQIAGRRAADLCKQMLTYAGRGRFQQKGFDLTELVRELPRLLEVGLPRDVHIRYDLAPPPLPLMGDAVQIRQVIMNLVANAADALGDVGGVVTLETGFLDADAAFLARARFGDSLSPGQYVCITVTDAGCGMDDLTQLRMFDPFFTTKRASRGLGLATVVGTVRRHGGAIHVDSQPGQGTTIMVLLPCARPSNV